MKIIEQDILSVQEGIICHQVNCQGKMGTGIALAIHKKWPKVYNNYIGWISNPGSLLGYFQLVEITPNLYVANMFCQDRYGRDKRYTDYNAVKQAFTELYNWWRKYLINLQIYIPYNMGCGNAGGDWKTYSDIVEEVCPGAIVCRKS